MSIKREDGGELQRQQSALLRGRRRLGSATEEDVGDWCRRLKRASAIGVGDWYRRVAAQSSDGKWRWQLV